MFPITLLGHQVTLREFQESDWQDVHRYASDPEVTKYEVWGPNSEEQTREFVKSAMNCQRQEPRDSFEFAVISKDSERLIGACGIRIKDFTHREGDIGYTLGKENWGRGLGTDVAKTLLNFGFEQLKLHRIWATCHIDNIASARVSEKAGMIKEGTLRKNRMQRGTWRDSYLYAVLESDR